MQDIVAEAPALDRGAEAEERDLALIDEADAAFGPLIARWGKLLRSNEGAARAFRKALDSLDLDACVAPIEELNKTYRIWPNVVQEIMDAMGRTLRLTGGTCAGSWARTTPASILTKHGFGITSRIMWAGSGAKRPTHYGTRRSPSSTSLSITAARHRQIASVLRGRC
jgi:hypothetical protein